MSLSVEAASYLCQRNAVAWLEVRLGRCRAVFSTRIGGCSAPPRDTLNLGLHQETDPSIAVRNRHTFAEAAGIDLESCVLCRQVHGTAVLVVGMSDAGAGALDQSSRLGESDAMVRSGVGPTLVVQVADCAPVVVADPETGAGACIHAGWRGAAAGVITRSVEALLGLTSKPPSALLAAVGPCARAGYEVGPEVWEAFACFGGARERFFSGQSDKRRLDLGGAVVAALRASGVRLDAITDTGACTLSRPDLFFCHRRDGPETGRMWGCLV